MKSCDPGSDGVDGSESQNPRDPYLHGEVKYLKTTYFGLGVPKSTLQRTGIRSPGMPGTLSFAMVGGVHDGHLGRPLHPAKPA